MKMLGDTIRVKVGDLACDVFSAMSLNIYQILLYSQRLYRFKVRLEAVTSRGWLILVVVSDREALSEKEKQSVSPHLKTFTDDSGKEYLVKGNPQPKTRVSPT